MLIEDGAVDNDPMQEEISLRNGIAKINDVMPAIADVCQMLNR